MENASKALIIAGAILISILLITIGIILINSGKDITTTGSSQMASQNIQTFNSQFTAYQGKIKGSQVRSLISAVRASNVTDESHQVGVYISEDSESKINATQNYEVTIYNAESTKTQTKPGGAAKTAVVSPSTWQSENGYTYCISISKTTDS